MIRKTLGICAATIAVLAGPALAGEAPPLVPDENGVLFAIGREDQSRVGFKPGGWRDTSVFRCTAGIDCDAATCPTRLVAASAAEHYASTSVERIVISFNLAQPANDLALVAARFGIERSVVRLDDGPAVTVTPEMMDPPPAEDIWGRFELPLGPMDAGIHEIELSVVDDGIENGRHSLDAIILKSAPPPS